jgi:hypothetical protein
VNVDVSGLINIGIPGSVHRGVGNMARGPKFDILGPQRLEGRPQPNLHVHITRATTKEQYVPALHKTPKKPVFTILGATFEFGNFWYAPYR